MPQRWLTSDILTTYLNDIFGNPGYVVNSVSQTTGHSGNYAVQMSVDASNMGDTVAGTIFYCDSASTLLMNAFGGNVTPGFPFSTRPANFTGWYKWLRFGGDTAGTYLVMTKWNASTHSRDTVAEISAHYLTTPMTAWTQFSVPITYLMNVNPDTLFLAAGIISSTPHIGSLFTLDDLAFNGSVPIGINDVTVATSSASVMPNPFTDNATLTLNNTQVQNGKLEIYDMLGNKVRQQENLSGSTFTISREGLATGIYFYTLSDKNALVVSGKLSVQ
jgi:hypothetical protein